MCQCQKMVIVLRLILQNASSQSNHWNWYCKTPSTDIGVDVAIAKHASDYILLKLILRSTCVWYCNCCCYCKTPLTNILIDIGIAKQSPWILEVKQYQKFYYCAALICTIKVLGMRCTLPNFSFWNCSYIIQIVHFIFRLPSCEF